LALEVRAAASFNSSSEIRMLALALVQVDANLVAVLRIASPPSAAPPAWR